MYRHQVPTLPIFRFNNSNRPPRLGNTLFVATVLLLFTGAALPSAGIGADTAYTYASWLASSSLSEWFGPVRYEEIGEKSTLVLRAGNSGSKLFPWYVGLRAKLLRETQTDIQQQMFIKAVEQSGRPRDHVQVSIEDDTCKISLDWAESSANVQSNTNHSCANILKFTPIVVRLPDNQRINLMQSLHHVPYLEIQAVDAGAVVANLAQTLFRPPAEVHVTMNDRNGALLDADNMQRVIITDETYWERVKFFAQLTGQPPDRQLICVVDGWIAKGGGKPSYNDYLPMETSGHGELLSRFAHQACELLAKSLSTGSANP